MKRLEEGHSEEQKIDAFAQGLRHRQIVADLELKRGAEGYLQHQTTN